ncbi:hypothetical protein [Oleiagrimonas soli]|uniref:ATP-grasp domain-containing protein n=1 Tax=Oleiagrimonas soli TaxID=1543381 RepID=A0A841KN55_9GAMM|nr:hypothetical protein [Oleiagrimonas soli]MBB6183478.1 hypothetical protein [Oleiagrimonas soli]
MNPQVLIFAPTDDAHVAAVGWALEDMGLQPRVAPSVRAGDGTKVSVHVDADQLRIDSTDFQAENGQIRSVWYRRPQHPEAGPCMEADRGFIEGQWRHFQDNVKYLGDGLIDAMWVNDPMSSIRAENKLVQLRVARELGLRFPDTVVSNDADELRRMIAKWPRVVYKTFYPHNWKSESSGSIYSMSVKLLDRDSVLPGDASIEMCPGIFQQYIDKAYDVRTTIIGDRYFSVRMRKQSGPAYVDWRGHMMDEDILIEPCTLPAAIEEKLRALMKRLGLIYGCVDLVVDKDGEAYFLEVNQAGQFLFLEEAVPDLPLLQAITALLATGRRDYAMEDGTRYNFADWLGTDHYQQIVQMQLKHVMSDEYRALES